MREDALHWWDWVIGALALAAFFPLYLAVLLARSVR